MARRAKTPTTKAVSAAAEVLTTRAGELSNSAPEGVVTRDGAAVEILPQGAPEVLGRHGRILGRRAPLERALERVARELLGQPRNVPANQLLVQG